MSECQQCNTLRKQLDAALVIVHRVAGGCKMVDWDACVARPKTCLDKGDVPCLACKALLVLKQVGEDL